MAFKPKINPDAKQISTRGLISEVYLATNIPREICKRVIEEYQERIKINLINGKMVMLEKFITIRILKKFFRKNARIFTTDESNFYLQAYAKCTTEFSHFARLFMKESTILPRKSGNNPGMNNLSFMSKENQIKKWGEVRYLKPLIERKEKKIKEKKK